MKVDELLLSDLVEFSEGNINIRGRRLVLHSLHAVGQFRKDILEMLGWEHARRIFTRFGYFWGQADAAAMKRIVGWKNLQEWLEAGSRLLGMEGIARARWERLEVDERTGWLAASLVWDDSGELEEHLMQIGRPRQPICWKITGYASGYATYCLGRNVYFIENQCSSLGDKFCRAEGRDMDSWGEKIKPHLRFFEAEDIRGIVERITIELHKKDRELARQRRQLTILKQKPAPYFAEVRSKSLQSVMDLAQRVSRFDSSLLITGETGVGKEIMARHIHHISHRSAGPFVAVNCSALPETLLESELFGHKAGAFTGAIEDRVGLFEQAVGGTIFLDEIGDISLAMQMKILRVLQEKEVMRVGESTPRAVDVRVIAATNRNLDKEVSDSRFREDLLYRLRVIEIEISPLRERREDIIPLARYLVDRLASRLNIPGLRLDVSCMDYFINYPWPGNVRELENAIERAAVFSPDGIIRPENLPPKIAKGSYYESLSTALTNRSLAQMEREHILRVLDATGGNKSKATAILGISLSTLWRKLKEINRA